MDEWNISVEEAAKIMGKSKDFLNTHIPQVTVKLRNDSFNFLGIYV